jgi:hypothetical protein
MDGRRHVDRHLVVAVPREVARRSVAAIHRAATVPKSQSSKLIEVDRCRDGKTQHRRRKAADRNESERSHP